MKFSDEVLGRIWGALRAGISQEAACVEAGVSGRQYRRLLEQGKVDEADGKRTRARKVLDEDRKAMALNTGSVERTFYQQAVSGDDSRATVTYLKLKQPHTYNPERQTIQREAVEAVFTRLDELAPGVGETVRDLLERGEPVHDLLPEPPPEESPYYVTRYVNEAEGAKALFLSFFEASMPEHLEFVKAKLRGRVYTWDDGHTTSLVGNVDKIEALAGDRSLLRVLLAPLFEQLTALPEDVNDNRS